MSFQAAMAAASSAATSSGSRVEHRQRATNAKAKSKAKRLRAATAPPAVASSRWSNSQHKVWRYPGTARLADNSTCDDSHDVKVRWCGRCSVVGGARRHGRGARRGRGHGWQTFRRVPSIRHARSARRQSGSQRIAARVWARRPGQRRRRRRQRRLSQRQVSLIRVLP